MSTKFISVGACCPTEGGSVYVEMITQYGDKTVVKIEPSLEKVSIIEDGATTHPDVDVKPWY